MGEGGGGLRVKFYNLQFSSLKIKKVQQVNFKLRYSSFFLPIYLILDSEFDHFNFVTLLPCTIRTFCIENRLLINKVLNSIS